MPTQQNKIFYGLADLYWFGITETYDSETGKTTSSYTKPAPWKGAVSLAQNPQGGKTIFRADDSDYWSGSKNSGYSGDLVTARIPDDVREYMGFESRDGDGVGYETEDSGSEEKYIGIMFRFAADKKAIRHTLLRCTMTRPAITSETTPEGNTPNIKGETTTITSTPRPDDDHLVHVFADPRTDATIYDKWFDEVQLPDIVSPAPSYTFTAVSPVGTEDPSEEGWFVLVGDTYVRTTDTTVDSNVTYYERTVNT